MFGEVEEYLEAPNAVRLPNVEEFFLNEWFVRFVHRPDAVAAYSDATLKKVSHEFFNLMSNANL